MKKKKIVTKVDIGLCMLLCYLDDLHGNVKMVQDEKLNCLFTELVNYVNDKISLPDYDIEKTYVVFEQEIPNNT